MSQSKSVTERKTRSDYTGEENESSRTNNSGEVLEHLYSYVKENWKTILSEVAAAGFSAYLSHSSKVKKEKRSTIN